MGQRGGWTSCQESLLETLKYWASESETETKTLEGPCCYFVFSVGCDFETGSRAAQTGHEHTGQP